MKSKNPGVCNGCPAGGLVVAGSTVLWTAAQDDSDFVRCYGSASANDHRIVATIVTSSSMPGWGGVGTPRQGRLQTRGAAAACVLVRPDGAPAGTNSDSLQLASVSHLAILEHLLGTSTS